MVAICLANMCDEISGVEKAPFRGLPFFLFSRRITTKCKDIGAAGTVSILESVVDSVFPHIRAGQMHARLQAALRLSYAHHLTSQIC